MPRSQGCQEGKSARCLFASLSTGGGGMAVRRLVEEMVGWGGGGGDIVLMELRIKLRGVRSSFMKTERGLIPLRKLGVCAL